VAGAFDAKVDISTAEASAALVGLRKEVKDTGTALVGLDAIIKASNGSIKEIAMQFTALVAAQRAAAAATKETAQADIAAARAAGIRNVADAKVGETLARKANQEAQATKAIEGANLAAERGFSVSQKRVADNNKIAASTEKVTQSQLAMHDSLSNSRYLMYDVGATYGVLAAGLMAIPAATAAVAASYQKDFAQVQRVTDGLDQTGLKTLKEGLKSLATDIPIGFDEISRIAQLGSQMGVANDQLVTFTETTAKFVAVTGISADTGATLFGRMESSFTADVQKYPDFFERLGSSIAYVGAKTVATDPEISSMLSQIGPLGAAAGMSASNVTGLAAALASVRVQPELARGTLTRVFGQLNRDTAEGSPKMVEFGKLMGITGDAATKLWQTDSSTFFTNLIKGLNGAQLKNGELTTTFDKLGIIASRDVSALTKLAVGYDTLQLSMDAANKGFTDGTALSTMSKVTFETVSAKLTEMANSWKNFADTIATSGPGLQVVSVFVDTLKNVAIWLDNLVKKAPAVGLIINMLMGISVVTALFLGFKAAQAFVMAGLIGFQQAASRGMAGGLSLGSTVKTLAQTMLLAKGATDAQSKALLAQVGAARALMIATTTTSERLAATATVSNNLEATNARTTSGIRGFGSALVGMAGGPIGIAVGALALLIGHFMNASVEAEAAGKAIATAMQQGADTGTRAVAEQLNSRKVTAFDGALGFSDIDKTVTQIAARAGVAFDKVVGSISKGEEGMKAFKAEMDTVAKGNGFKDLNDAISNPIPGKKSADLQFLNNVVKEYAQSNVEAAKGLKAVDAAAPKAGAALGEIKTPAEEDATSLQKMTKALKDLNDEAFGTINAESALQGALVKIGEGLGASKSFNVNNDAGRTNIANVEDTLAKARDKYKQLFDSQQMTAQQAAQGYADFSDKLMSDLRTKFGANTAAIDASVNQAKELYASAMGSKPVSVPVTTNPAQVQAAATQTAAQVQATFGNLKTELTVGMDQAHAEQGINQLVTDLSKITGESQMVVIDALTNPASEKADQIKSLLKSIEDHTYVAPVNANTDAAVTNVRNFQAYAASVLASTQAAFNQVASSAPTLAKYIRPMFKGVVGTTAPLLPSGPRASVPTAVAPVQAAVAAASDSTPLDNISAGLKKIQDAAALAASKTKGVGTAAKEAAKDFASGISEAVQAATDYGNRLKTALMSAYNQQYALTTATDEYHSALNAITKKREDEIKQVDDLRTKIKQLNDERDKELITANKAKIEQGISLKYGEGARAADYGNQAQTALDNAAAKQKEINASSKEAQTIQDGIGALTGYSDAAIANRAALRGLETKMIDMVAAYATLGHSTDEVRAYTKNLTGQYQKDVGQIGFNVAAVGNLQGSLERYIGVIDKVPQVVPTTVTADTTAAQDAFNALNSAIDEAKKGAVIPVSLNTAYLETQLRSIKTQIAGGGSPDDPSMTAFRPGTFAPPPGGMYTGGMVRGFASGGMVPGTAPSNPRADNMMAQVDGKGLIKIRSREFIQPQEAVDYYGPDFMEAVRTMSLPKFNMGGSVSGARSGGGSASQAVVELGAATLAAMAEMRQDIKLFTENRTIAESANAGNRQLAAEGHRS